MLPHGLLRGVVVVGNIDVGLPTPLVPDAHRHQDDEDHDRERDGNGGDDQTNAST